MCSVRYIIRLHPMLGGLPAAKPALIALKYLPGPNTLAKSPAPSAKAGGIFGGVFGEPGNGSLG